MKELGPNGYLLCRKGHEKIPENVGHGGVCLACRRLRGPKNKEKYLLYQKEYREKNKEKLSISHKERYEQNKEKRLLQVKEYREKNKEKISAYREKNKEKRSARFKEYREKNKEKISAYQKEYREKNKEKRSALNKEYREKLPEACVKAKLVGQFGIPKDQIPEEIIEIKRLTIQLHRRLRHGKQQRQLDFDYGQGS